MTLESRGRSSFLRTLLPDWWFMVTELVVCECPATEAQSSGGSRDGVSFAG